MPSNCCGDRKSPMPIFATWCPRPPRSMRPRAGSGWRDDESLFDQVSLQVEVQAKYSGYLIRQTREIDRQLRNEELRLPEDLDLRRGRRTFQRSSAAPVRRATGDPGTGSAHTRNDAGGPCPCCWCISRSAITPREPTRRLKRVLVGGLGTLLLVAAVLAIQRRTHSPADHEARRVLRRGKRFRAGKPRPARCAFGGGADHPA